RRGLVEVDVRERPRLRLASRPPGLRGSRPAGAALTDPQVEAADAAIRAIVAGDPTPILLDGVTGGGKTAIYAEAIVASLERARAAIVLGSATPAVESVGHARDGQYRRVALPVRPVGARPVVEVIDLREELRTGNRGLLSGRLTAAIAALDRDAGDQTILTI